jgi:phosphatidylserine decarboxylase precursor-related protein
MSVFQQPADGTDLDYEEFQDKPSSREAMMNIRHEAIPFIGIVVAVGACSELNQHNKILIEGSRTRCLLAQIAGSVARRVVYWLSHETPTPVKAGDRIGMMKFGSRLDIYLPEADVDVLTKPGDRVLAGETIIARVKSSKFDES